MSKGRSSKGKFIATDITTIAPAADADEGTEFDSVEVAVWDVFEIALQMRVTGGHANCALTVDFDIVSSLDGVTWDTVKIATITATLNGTTAVLKTSILDVTPYNFIKLFKVTNNETVAGRTATAVNLWWGKSYGGVS